MTVLVRPLLHTLNFRNNKAVVYWSVGGVIIISIVILSTSDGYNSGEWVFTDFANEVGYSDGVAWMLGLLQSALSLIGYDVVMHMTEEMPRPRRDAPQAILLSIIVGGTTYVYLRRSLSSQGSLCFTGISYKHSLMCAAVPHLSSLCSSP